MSHMWLQRVLKRDASFPRPTYLGRLRFFKITDLETWERASAPKASHRKSGRPRNVKGGKAVPIAAA